jgi:sugar phosphate isomerase/epimerase
MHVGVQLRPWLIQVPQPGLAAVFAEAASAGFDSIEIGAHYLDWDQPQTIRALLDQHGLALSGVHAGGDIFNPDNVRRVRAQIERVAWIAAAAGAPFLLYSGLLLEEKSPEQLTQELAQIQGAAEACARHGLRLLYHNHWWEIKNQSADLEYYARHTDPALVSFCLDLGWVHRAGGDPLQALERFGGRCPYVHLRDDSPEQVWKGLGQGVMDFTHLLPRLAEQNVEWVVIEQDDIQGPVAAAVGASRRYLRQTMNW